MTVLRLITISAIGSVDPLPTTLHLAHSVSPFHEEILAFAISLDHLIGASEERLRDREAESVGGLDVEDQLEFGRLLDR